MYPPFSLKFNQVLICVVTCCASRSMAPPSSSAMIEDIDHNHENLAENIRERDSKNVTVSMRVSPKNEGKRVRN